MSEERGYRLITKNFSCANCGRREKRLVNASETSVHCSVCDCEAIESNLSEFNREDLDRTYRIVFNQNGEGNRNANEYHNRTDIFDRNPNNIYADPRERVIHLSREEIERRNAEARAERERHTRLSGFYPGRAPQGHIRRGDEASASNPNFNHVNYARHNFNQQPNQTRSGQVNVDNNNPNNYFGMGNSSFNNNRNVSNENTQNQSSFRSQADPTSHHPNLNPNQSSQRVRISPFDLLFGFPFVNVRSPFSGSVNRHPFTHNFGDFFTDFFFIQPSEDFFRDNYASNFSSNFADPLTRIIFIRTINPSGPQNRGASPEALRRVKRFKMSEEHTKRSDNGEVEYPSCSICLTEVNKGEDSVLVPCGHMYHEPCIMKWFELNDKCPVCRYELNDNRSRGSVNNSSSNVFRNANANSNVNSPDLNRNLNSETTVNFNLNSENNNNPSNSSTNNNNISNLNQSNNGNSNPNANQPVNNNPNVNSSSANSNTANDSKNLDGNSNTNVNNLTSNLNDPYFNNQENIDPNIQSNPSTLQVNGDGSVPMEIDENQKESNPTDNSNNDEAPKSSKDNIRIENIPL